eukprot:TRINITY_DN3503_c0_g1_i2.p1 TRINITY_DN3503_c0_g1~~TRINITY_DN3503_c0_g1_i2.p1  ORF type:complete len:118 (-),score=5.47 TRINITY_DN3503_c0_g1_i2:343-696(-)
MGDSSSETNDADLFTDLLLLDRNTSPNQVQRVGCPTLKPQPSLDTVILTLYWHLPLELLLQNLISGWSYFSGWYPETWDSFLQIDSCPHNVMDSIMRLFQNEVFIWNLFLPSLSLFD